MAVTTLLADLFEDASIGADWTTVENDGTVVEAGGALTLDINNDIPNPYWNETVKNYTGARVSLAALGMTEGALLCVEVSLEDQQAGPWSDTGPVLYEDDNNMIGPVLNHQGSVGHGAARIASATDNVFALGTRHLTDIGSDCLLRLYWNSSTTELFTIVNDDILLPGYMRGYFSVDAGVTYVAIAAAEELAIVPTHVQIFGRGNQPSNPIDVDYLYFIVAQETSEEEQPSCSTSTAAIQRAKTHNLPFYFVHVSGFPYLWFTKVPASWDVPTDWTYTDGLMFLPGVSGNQGDMSRSMDIDPLGGIQDPEDLTLTLMDDTSETLAGLFCNSQNRDYATGALLVTNNMKAGQDEELQVDHAMTGAAATDGTIYIGNQTITYLYRTDVLFTGVTRGRYAYLDSNLDEGTFADRIKWSSKLNVPPWVTVYPRTIRDRVVTVYRNYFDPDTGTALAKAQSEVRFRGTVASIRDTEDHLGFELGLTSILDMLNSEIMMDGVGEQQLNGYHLPKYKGSYTNSYIELLEVLTEMVDTDGEWSWGKQIQSQYTQVNIGNASFYETPNALISAVNTALMDAWTAGKTKSCWQVKRGKNNKLQISYDARGYYSSAPSVQTLIPKAGTQTFNTGVRGSLRANDLSMALGFGSADDSWIDVCSMTGKDYLHNFSMCTNQSYYTYDHPDNNGGKGGYVKPSVEADEELARVFFLTDNTTAIPVADIDGTHTFVEILPDGSPFLVMVPDTIIYEASYVEFVTEEVILKNAAYDTTHLIGQIFKPDQVYSIPETTALDEIPSLRQVFQPSGRQQFTPTNVTYGVQNTMLWFLCSTGTSGYNGDYDILPTGWGLGIPEEYIDVDSFEALGSEYGFAALERKHILTEPQSLWDFLETECMTLGFWIVLKDGKITVMPNQTATGWNVAATIDDNARVINGTESSMDWHSSPEGIINSISLKYDYDHIAGDFYTTREFSHLASMTDYKVMNSIEVENQGLISKKFGASSDKSVTEIDQLIQDRLEELATESWTYTTTVNRSVDNLVIGDVVRVTDSRVPNPTTGTRGITKHLGRVQSFSFDELEGTGEIVIRMVYDYSAAVDLSNTSGAWNIGTMAPAAGITKADQETLTVDPTKYQPNKKSNGKEDYSEGDLVQVVGKETGDSIDAIVVSYDSSIGELILDRPITALQDEPLSVTFQTFDKISASSTTANEVQAVFIGSPRGTIESLNGSATGFKLG